MRSITANQQIKGDFVFIWPDRVGFACRVLLWVLRMISLRSDLPVFEPGLLLSKIRSRQLVVEEYLRIWHLFQLI